METPLNGPALDLLAAGLVNAIIEIRDGSDPDNVTKHLRNILGQCYGEEQPVPEVDLEAANRELWRLSYLGIPLLETTSFLLDFRNEMQEHWQGQPVTVQGGYAYFPQGAFINVNLKKGTPMEEVSTLLRYLADVLDNWQTGNYVEGVVLPDPPERPQEKNQ